MSIDEVTKHSSPSSGLYNSDMVIKMNCMSSKAGIRDGVYKLSKLPLNTS